MNVKVFNVNGLIASHRVSSKSEVYRLIHIYCDSVVSQSDDTENLLLVDALGFDRANAVVNLQPELLDLSDLTLWGNVVLANKEEFDALPVVESESPPPFKDGFDRLVEVANKFGANVNRGYFEHEAYEWCLAKKRSPANPTIGHIGSTPNGVIYFSIMSESKSIGEFLLIQDLTSPMKIRISDTK